jgi:adenylate cyclase
VRADTGRELTHSFRKRRIIMGWVANSFGAGIVFTAIGFLLAVFFSEADRDQLLRDNIVLVVGAVIVLGLIATVLQTRREKVAFAWVNEGRDPTPEEYRQTLRMPTFTAILTWVLWGVGGAVCFFANLDHSLDAAILIAASIWIGGESTTALAYLMSERMLRPITAVALAAHAPESAVGLTVRQRLMFVWSLGTAAPIMGVVAVGIIGLTDSGVDAEAVAGACAFLGMVTLGFGLLLTLITARAISDPLTAMRDAVSQIGVGGLDAHVPVEDATEVGLLQAGFNQMAEGLRERERIRDLFGRQVGHDVARAALAEGTRLGGEEREIGAIFVDLTGSTSMSLAMPPTEVVRLLNRFFRVVVDVVEREGGLVNKFEGDAALCVFGAPAASADPAGDALRTGRNLCRRLQREVPEVGFGIGISAGRAVAGNVGSESRFEYTVIGDPVNEASRLCDVARERSLAVLASEAAVNRAAPAEAEAWTVGDRTILRGRLEATGLATPRDEAPSPAQA